jgi:hypothetical protein
MTRIGMRSLRFPLLAALSATVCLGAAAPAHAQSTVEAEKLFRDGKVLMKQGKFADACSAFEASQRIEANIATLTSLADCSEKNGKLATAWGYFLKAESLTRSDAKQTKLNATARQRAAAIEPRLSYLTINLPDESRIEGLVVARNGVVVDPGTFNRAVPVDGGEYEIQGKAPGHEPWTTRVTVKNESDRQSVEVPKFKELPKLLEPKQPTTPENPDGVVLDTPPRPLFTPMRYGALGAAGVAVGAVVAGAVFGTQSSSLNSDAEDLCVDGRCTAEQAAAANDKRDDAESKAMLANVSFGIGAAAAIGAGVLWYLGAPSDRAPSDEDAEEEAGEVSLRPHVGDFTGVTLGTRF